MFAFNFPEKPVHNQVFAYGGRAWKWNQSSGTWDSITSHTHTIAEIDGLENNLNKLAETVNKDVEQVSKDVEQVSKDVEQVSKDVEQVRTSFSNSHVRIVGSSTGTTPRALSPPRNPIPPEDGLQAFYSFGPTLYRTLDVSGNERHITNSSDLINKIEFVPGAVGLGSGAFFKGEGGVRLDRPIPVQFPFSVSMWVKPQIATPMDLTTGNGYIFDSQTFLVAVKTPQAGGPNPSSANPATHKVVYITHNYIGVDLGLDVPIDQWSFVTFVCKSPTENYGYLNDPDSNPVVSKAIGNFNSYGLSPASVSYLGTGFHSGYFRGPSFRGALDSLGFWNRTLSTQEIKYLFNARGDWDGQSESSFVFKKKHVYSAIANIGAFDNRGRPARFMRQFAVNNFAGVPSLAGPVTPIGADVVVEPGLPAVDIITTSDTFSIVVTGTENDKWRWAASVDINEVPPPNLLEEGLLAFYKLDDLTDASGNNHTLTNNGGVTFSTGKIDNAAQFGGTNYLTAPIDQTGINSFSLAAWINPSDLDGPRFVINGLTGTNWGYGGICLDTENGELIGMFNYGGDGKHFAVKTNTRPIIKNQWQHIAVTRLGTVLNLYLNGSLILSGACGTQSVPGGSPISLGSNANGTYGRYKGLIDAAGIWNRALTYDEIIELYNNGNGLEHPFW